MLQDIRVGRLMRSSCSLTFSLNLGMLGEINFCIFRDTFTWRRMADAVAKMVQWPWQFKVFYPLHCKNVREIKHFKEGMLKLNKASRSTRKWSRLDFPTQLGSPQIPAGESPVFAIQHFLCSSRAVHSCWIKFPKFILRIDIVSLDFFKFPKFAPD